ncbi:MAG: transposase [Clostridia bacterium]|nr:transposase [Clostridia bacterium]
MACSGRNGQEKAKNGECRHDWGGRDRLAVLGLLHHPREDHVVYKACRCTRSRTGQIMYPPLTSSAYIDNLESLKATLSQAGRADYVVVADRALASVENVFLLDSRNAKFVAPADDDARYIVDEMKRSKEMETIDAWLHDVRDRKINKRRYKRLSYADKRIDAFFSGPLRKYRKIYNPKAASDDARLDFTWSVDEQALQRLMPLNGKYVVISNEMDPAVTAADICLTSRKRSHIETRMRRLKSQLKVRPVFLESDIEDKRACICHQSRSCRLLPPRADAERSRHR